MPDYIATQLGVHHVTTLLRTIFPNSSDIQDPVLVSIDFDGAICLSGTAEGVTTQVGLAILDTRTLDLLFGDEDVDPLFSVRTYNFVAGSNTYFNQQEVRCHWTSSMRIPARAATILETIKKVLRPYQDRNIIFVGHGLETEFRVLDTLGFDLQEYSVVGIMDTCEIAKKILLRSRSLKGLVKCLGWPLADCVNYHCAGNDASVALRALLLMSIIIIENTEFSNEGERFKMARKVNTMHAITMDTRWKHMTALNGHGFYLYDMRMHHRILNVLTGEEVDSQWMRYALGRARHAQNQLENQIGKVREMSLAERRIMTSARTDEDKEQVRALRQDHREAFEEQQASEEQEDGAYVNWFD